LILVKVKDSQIGVGFRHLWTELDDLFVSLNRRALVSGSICLTSLFIELNQPILLTKKGRR
jgi:hypothetical protein